MTAPIVMPSTVFPGRYLVRAAGGSIVVAEDELRALVSSGASALSDARIDCLHPRKLAGVCVDCDERVE